jgi:hypothetical protein
MEVVGQVLVALLLVALGCAVALLVAAARVRPDEPGVRFLSRWLGAFGLIVALSSGCGLASVLVEFGVGTTAELAAALALNVVFQPVALLFCWVGVCKIALGLCGLVAYAGRRVPEGDLADLTPSERRQLVWFCVCQGVVGLLFVVAVSAALASPLVSWLSA